MAECQWCFESTDLQLDCLAYVCLNCYDDLNKQETFQCSPKCQYLHKGLQLLPLPMTTDSDEINMFQQKVIKREKQTSDLKHRLIERGRLYQTLLPRSKSKVELKIIALTLDTVEFTLSRLEYLKSHFNPSMLESLPDVELSPSNVIKIKDHNDMAYDTSVFPFLDGIAIPARRGIVCEYLSSNGLTKFDSIDEDHIFIGECSKGAVFKHLNHLNFIVCVVKRHVLKKEYEHLLFIGNKRIRCSGNYLILSEFDNYYNKCVINNILTNQRWTVDNLGIIQYSNHDDRFYDSEVLFGITDDHLIVYQTTMSKDCYTGKCIQNTILIYDYKTNTLINKCDFDCETEYATLTPDSIIIRTMDDRLKVYNLDGQLLHDEPTKYKRVFYNWVNDKVIILT